MHSRRCWQVREQVGFDYSSILIALVHGQLGSDDCMEGALEPSLIGMNSVCLCLLSSSCTRNIISALALEHWLAA